MNKTYRLVVMQEDIKFLDQFQDFNDETELRNFVINFLDGNKNYTVIVYNASTGKKLHVYDYCIGPRNEMTLYDEMLE